MPLWVVLGQNALYIAVGFAWLSFADDATGEEATIPLDSDGSYTYQVAGLLWFLVFADNLLGRLEGTGVTSWCGLRSGSWAVIVASLVLSLVCQLLFWSAVVPAVNRRNWEE